MSRYHYSKAVKFYFKGERRRFQVSVPWEGTGVFLNLKNTIAFHFKDISMAKLNLFWKDAEGDMFSLRSDEDVKIALKDSDNSKLLRVYSCAVSNEDNTAMKSKATQTPAVAMLKSSLLSQIDLTVTCDGCRNDIGNQRRYHCLNCPDFDLCEICEQVGLHDQHPMVRFKQNAIGEETFYSPEKLIKARDELLTDDQLLKKVEKIFTETFADIDGEEKRQNRKPNRSHGPTPSASNSALCVSVPTEKSGESTNEVDDVDTRSPFHSGSATERYLEHMVSVGCIDENVWSNQANIYGRD